MRKQIFVNLAARDLPKSRAFFESLGFNPQFSDDQAAAAGGSTPRPPQDHGNMHSHGFDDLDGHVWGLLYMDLAAAPAQA